MKMNGKRRKTLGQDGFALIFAMALVLIISFMAVSQAYLSVEGTWRNTNYLLANQAFYAAESGVEDGLSRLIAGTIVDGAPGSTSWNVGNTYSSPSADFANSFTVQHWVVGGSLMTNPITGAPYYSIQSTGYDGTAKRAQKTIQRVVALRQSAPFGAGVVGCNGITVNGRSFIDSYNSSKGTYASQVVGNHAGSSDYAQTCVTNANISLIGGAAIYGNALATGVVTTTGGAAVYGTINQNQPVSNCDPLGVAALVAANKPSGTPTSISLNGNNNQTLTAPGTFYYSGIDLKSQSNLTISGTGNVTMFINGNFSLGGGATFTIASTAKVTMYVTGTIAADGGGIYNQGPPPNLIIYSSYSGSSGVDVGGNYVFSGAVYAPLTDVYIHGTADYEGAVRGLTVTDKGTSDFHYDVALQNVPGGGILGYVPIAWKEIYN